MSSLQYRPDIDGLRALAVLAVVGYHLNPTLIPGGFLGVDIFFVISGYLISLIILRERGHGTFSIRGFYSRRIRRLFPSLLLVVSAVLALGYFSLFSDEYQRVGEHASAAMLFMLNFRLMDEAGYFDVAAESKPLLHLWSLSVEEQFYFGWPALLILLQRLRINIAIALGLLFSSSLLFAVLYGAGHTDQVFFHPLARSWQLAAGAMLALWHFQKSTDTPPIALAATWRREAAAWLSLVMIVWGLWRTGRHIIQPNIYTLAPVLGAVGLILTKEASVNKLLSNKPAVWIGLISYPLYLWHWPLLSYIRIMEAGSPSSWLLWAAVGIAFLLAWATYHFVERRLWAAKHHRAIVIGLATTMLIVLVTNTTIMGNGLPDRPAVQYMKAAEAQMLREPRQDNSCIALFPAGNAPIYCRQDNPGDRMIAIIGDSHAHVLFPGVSQVVSKRGYGTLMLANSSCPPLDGAVTGKTAAERVECSKAVEIILATVTKDSRIEHVIVATRGPLYLTAKGFGPAEANYSHPPITLFLPATTTKVQGKTAFAVGLHNTVSRITESGKTVGYLLQVPELGVPARNCLGRPLSLSPAHSCDVPINDYRTRMQTYRSILREVSAAFTNLNVFDPLPLFCKVDKCQALINGQLMYADDDHLSVLGSRFLAEHFAGFLPDITR